MQQNGKRFNKILIAEDDKDDYLFFTEALENVVAGVIPERAKTGLECINMLKSATYDVVFLDLNMPVKNGIDCLKFIKAEEDLQATPVIIYSTSHYLRDIDAAYKNGALYYIIKPGDADHLPGILNKIFTRLSNGVQQPAKDEFVVGLKSSSEVFE